MAFKIYSKQINNQLSDIYESKFLDNAQGGMIRKSDSQTRKTTAQLIQSFKSEFGTLFKFLDAVMEIKTKKPFDFEEYLNSENVLIVPNESSQHSGLYEALFKEGDTRFSDSDAQHALSFGQQQLRNLKKLIRDILQGFAKEHIVKKIVMPKSSSGLFSNINEADIENLDGDEPMTIVQAVSRDEAYISTNKFAQALYKLGKKLHQAETASAA